MSTNDENQTPNQEVLTDNDDALESAFDLPAVDTDAPVSIGEPIVETVKDKVNVDIMADEADVDAPFILEPRGPSTNVQQDAEVFFPIDKAKWDPRNITLQGMPDTIERTERVLDAIPNIDLEESSAGKEWLASLRNANYTVHYAEFFKKTVERQNSMFRQFVPSERGPLSAATPKIKDDEATMLSGERGVMRVRAILGLGSIVQIPLWHSGFWITLKAPEEGALLELNRRIAEEKIRMGRNTWGLALSNISVFYAGWVMDFVLAHVYQTSLKDNSSLRDKISSLDIHVLAWGLACVIWPNGFQYARACLNDANEGKNVVLQDRIALGKLQWTDTTTLTPWQIAHMAQRQDNTMTNEAVDRYRNEFTVGQPREISLSPDLKVTMKVPSLNQYLTSGYAWINNIVAMVDRVFSTSGDMDERNQYIIDQGRATNMRQFSHWIVGIRAKEKHVVEDRETIDALLDSLSSNDDLRETYFSGVRSYMEDSTMSIIATPLDPDNEKTVLPRFPHLLPLDVMSTFFILLVQKTAQIQNRL